MVDNSHRPATSCSVSAGKFPKEVLETIFSFLSLDDLRSCSLVCKSWCNYLNDGNSDVWRLVSQFSGCDNLYFCGVVLKTTFFGSYLF